MKFIDYIVFGVKDIQEKYGLYELKSKIKEHISLYYFAQTLPKHRKLLHQNDLKFICDFR